MIPVKPDKREELIVWEEDIDGLDYVRRRSRQPEPAVVRSRGPTWRGGEGGGRGRR
jgi:hypothetical protein